MALNSYSALQASIANFLARGDLGAEIPDFIALTEADFNRRLRIRAMETTNTSFTVDSETESLPTGFLQLRSIYINGTNKIPLQFITPYQQHHTQGGSQGGEPRAYSIEAGNFRFSPSPNSSYTATINYYKAIDALSNSNTTNHILTNHPDIYLYGSLYFASTFLRGMDPNTVAQFKAQYDASLAQCEAADEKDKYNASPLRIRSDINTNNYDNIK